MTTYTHWLVTRGRDNQDRSRANPFTPIVLAPIEKWTLRDLRGLVQARIDHLAGIFLPETASAIDHLKAGSRKSIAETYSDLWVREVRLTAENDADANEGYVHWALFGNGRLPEPWQGGADGIIPKETPYTIWRHAARLFKVIEE